MRHLNQAASGGLPVEQRVDYEAVESHTEGMVVGRVSESKRVVDMGSGLI